MRVTWMPFLDGVDLRVHEHGGQRVTCDCQGIIAACVTLHVLLHVQACKMQRACCWIYRA